MPSAAELRLHMLIMRTTTTGGAATAPMRRAVLRSGGAAQFEAARAACGKWLAQQQQSPGAEPLPCHVSHGEAGAGLQWLRLVGGGMAAGQRFDWSSECIQALLATEGTSTSTSTTSTSTSTEGAASQPTCPHVHSARRRVKVQELEEALLSAHAVQWAAVETELVRLAGALRQCRERVGRALCGYTDAY